MMVPEVLNAHPLADLVGTFALDEEAGAIHSGYRRFEFIAPAPVLHEISHIADAASDIESLAPDLIVVVEPSQVISLEIFVVPPRGVVGFHSAELPARPGCSPMIWTIAEKA